MANNCDFQIKLVSDNRSSLERAIRVFQCKDYNPGIGLFLPGVHSIYCINTSMMVKGGLYSTIIVGVCSWSVHTCMQNNDYSYFNGRIDSPQFNVTRNFEGKIKYRNLPIPLDELCSQLGMAAQVWSREGGLGFEESWVLFNRGGKIESTGIICEDWDPIHGKNGFDFFGEFIAEDRLFTK